MKEKYDGGGADERIFQKAPFRIKRRGAHRWQKEGNWKS